MLIRRSGIRRGREIPATRGGRGKGGITKGTGAYAGGQYRATLQACFCHRQFLRCGRSDSGEE
jgi:hypothetical protein